ncbi:MAG: UDP-N-acetylmuramate--L-alanine ligase [Bifidobacterium sp.]|nr:UDP-N-acetylmuramate--L-alanine ligase [Bifidobacterium sp.]
MSEQNASETTNLDPTVARFGQDERAQDLGGTHFIGIGGAGMSVLAEMLHQQGVPVDGSDMAPGAKTDRLISLGVPVQFGQRAENITDQQVVVYSSAIKPDNPEIVAAEAAGARLVHRSDILDLLMRGKRAVTVAGAHGKTTTSSMLAHILTNAGTGALADPSYAIGGSIQGPDGSTMDGGHAGLSDVLVAEADESDGSFMKYTPAIAIVTNAEPDHLDHYGDAEHYHRAFVEHTSHARQAIIMCVDDPGALDVLRMLPADVAARAIAYGTTPRDELGDLNGARYVRIESETEQAGSGAERFTLDIPADVDPAGTALTLPVTLAVPGIHNARNATAAILAAILLGMDPKAAADALRTFLGASRRFQVHGDVDGITVVDDYAHHPTEIGALLDAARRRYPQAKLRVLFQPHLFSRTKFFAPEFAGALAKADDVIVTGIFPAREKQAAFPDVTPSTIVEALPADADTAMEAVEDMATAAQMMAMRAEPGDVVLTVGAGDITRMAPVVLHVLEARFADKD